MEFWEQKPLPMFHPRVVPSCCGSPLAPTPCTRCPWDRSILGKVAPSPSSTPPMLRDRDLETVTSQGRSEALPSPRCGAAALSGCCPSGGCGHPPGCAAITHLSCLKGLLSWGWWEPPSPEQQRRPLGLGVSWEEPLGSGRAPPWLFGCCLLAHGSRAHLWQGLGGAGGTHTQLPGPAWPRPGGLGIGQAQMLLSPGEAPTARHWGLTWPPARG